MKSPKFTEDLTGNRYGMLVVIRKSGVTERGSYVWECVCDCGKVKSVVWRYLLNGDTKSCGCYAIKKTKEIHTKHGRCVNNKKDPERSAWRNMKERCYNENNKYFKNYGGRGIIVCDRWINSFDNFIEDLGLRPSLKHSLGRKDNDGNYEPDNVKWETTYEQNRNKTTNRFIEYNGKRLIVSEWAKELGISASGIASRERRYNSSFEDIYNHFINKKNEISNKVSDKG